MKLKTALLISLMIHVLLAFSMLYRRSYEISKDKQIDKVDISIIDSPVKEHSPGNLNPDHINSKYNDGEGKSRPAIGSPEFGPGTVSLDVLLTGNDYLMRIHLLIDPVWIHKIKDKILYYKQVRKHFPECSTKLLITADYNGKYKSIQVLEQCEQAPALDKEAVDSFYYIGALPPPPKNLLENNELTLWWQFELKK